MRTTDEEMQQPGARQARLYIRRCPLCGGRASEGYYRKPYPNGWIGCINCRLYTNWTNKGYEDAVKRWNRREGGSG